MVTPTTRCSVVLCSTSCIWWRRVEWKLHKSSIKFLKLLLKNRESIESSREKESFWRNPCSSRARSDVGSWWVLHHCVNDTDYPVSEQCSSSHKADARKYIEHLPSLMPFLPLLHFAFCCPDLLRALSGHVHMQYRASWDVIAISGGTNQ